MPSLNSAAAQSPFTDKMLDDFRKHGDPLADEVIEAFATQHGSSIKELTDKLQDIARMPVRDEMHDVIHEHFPHDAVVCDALEKYFTHASLVPEWADPEKLKLGGHVFQDHMFSGFMMLACSSLPNCYACQPDVKVLSFTRRLVDNAPKRIVETAQMVTDVMGDGGLSIKNGHVTGKGIQSILKVRLLHACVRYLLLNKEQLTTKHCDENDINPDNFFSAYIHDAVQTNCKWHGEQKPTPWDVKNDGTPLNAEVLAGVLLTFSYSILRGLKTIGVKLNARQQNAYLHSWNVAGHALGVEEKFLAEYDTYEKAEVIYNQILQRRRGKTEDGMLLQQALLDAFSLAASKVIPFPLDKILHIKRMPRLITSILISKKSFAALGLKLSIYDHFIRIFVWLLLKLFGFFVNLGFLRVFADVMFKYLAKTLWGWREDYPDAKPETIKGGKPLSIPHKLVATSYLSGKYKS